MAIWNEIDHPRDDNGKFTYKNGCEQSRKSKMQNRADILFDSMYNKQNQFNNKLLRMLGGVEQNVYTKTGKNNFINLGSDIFNQPNSQYKVTQHSLKNQVSVDNIDNSIIYGLAKKMYGLETAENLLMSKKEHYLNTPYAKKHLIFNNYEALNSDLKNYFKDKITEQIGADKLKSTKGIYFEMEDNSSINMANALVKNSQFINNVAKNQKLLQMGNYINSSVQFSDNNFHYAVGKADIRDMHYNKYGDLDLLITDVYDFNDDKNASDLIKVGRDRQEKGEIIPYFYIYHVIIPKNIKLKE